jgi:uncharacterized protein DUF1707/cell wall-active antibiotic response 4TMS protein YvqF
MADTSLVSVRDARERTIAILSDLFAADDLELDEFERRVSLVHRASSVAEIEQVVADLKKPDHVVKPQPSTALVPVSQVPERQTRLAIMSGVDKRGAWTAPRSMRVIAIMGGVNLDYREAKVAAGVIDLYIFALMGGVSIIVPPDLAVEVSGSAIMGGFDEIDRAPAQPDPDRPTLRIHGFAMMGGVSIETRLVGESWRDARRRKRAERKALRRAE